MNRRQPEQDDTAEDHPGRLALGPRAWVRFTAVTIRFSRSGGPGGQNVNKVSTRAELRVPLHAIHGMDEAALRRLRALAGRRMTADDELVITSDEHRSQVMNRDAVVERLRQIVAKAAQPPRVRRPTKRSKASKERRLDAKKRVSGIKSSRRWRSE